MKLKKILTLLTICTVLGITTVACESKDDVQVSVDELVYPVDLKAELKEGVTYLSLMQRNYNALNKEFHY